MGQTLALPAGIYRIKNFRSETYLTCTDEPSTIGGWASRPAADNQKWELIKATEASYHIRNIGSGKYMSVSGVADGTNICATENPSRWTLLEVEDSGTWLIAAEGTHSVADLHEGRNENGRFVSLYPSRNGVKGCGQQRWRFKRVGDAPTDGTEAASPPAGRTSENFPNNDNGDFSVPSPQRRGYPGIIPPATYAIYNVSGGTSLNPNPHGSAEWTLEYGVRGYLFRHRASRAFLGHGSFDLPDGRTMITLGAPPVEWVITRAQAGYYIHPASLPSLFAGLSTSENGAGGGSELICLSSENTSKDQVWRFEMANV